MNRPPATLVNRPQAFSFGSNRQLLKLVSSLLTRWDLYINEYNYDIVYRNGKFNTTADFLSRIPNKKENTSNDERNIFKIFENGRTESLGTSSCYKKTSENIQKKIKYYTPLYNTC